MVKKRKSSSRGMAAPPSICTAPLDVLHVLPIVFGDRGAPFANGSETSAYLRKALDTVGFVSRQTQSLRGHEANVSPVQHSRQGLCVSEGVMDAWQVSMREVVRSTVEEAIVSAGRHQFK